MPRVRVLYFARSREVAGTSEQVFELGEGSNTEALLQAIVLAHPALESVMKTCVFALNQEYVKPNEKAQLTDGDEVAIIPPLSGG